MNRTLKRCVLLLLSLVLSSAVPATAQEDCCITGGYAGPALP